MNRRSFFRTLGAAVAGFSILPSAATYARTWKPLATSPILVPNPEWLGAPYEMSFIWHPEAIPIFKKNALEVLAFIGNRGISNESIPLRFRAGKDGFEKVEPFILQPV